MKAFTKSWKTSLAGVCTIATAAITLIIKPLLDDNDATMPDWGEFIPILIAGIGALFARDANVTSEQQGLK